MRTKFRMIGGSSGTGCGVEMAKSQLKREGEFRRGHCVGPQGDRRK